MFVEDGWTLVKHRRWKPTKIGTNSLLRFDPSTVNIAQNRDQLLDTKLYRVLSKLDLPIICLGLGTLTHRDSLIQLQLLIMLNSSVKYCDPIFTSSEKKYLNSLGFKQANSIKVSDPTLFFMIHCPHEVYDEVVRENQSNLEHVIIVGNSFKGYRDMGKFNELEFNEITLDCLGNTFYNTSLISHLHRANSIE